MQRRENDTPAITRCRAPAGVGISAMFLMLISFWAFGQVRHGKTEHHQPELPEWLDHFTSAT